MASRSKILAFTGSIKKKSSNAKLLNYVQNEFGTLIDVIIYPSLENLPHFNPDLSSENTPKSVLDFREQIAAADAVLITTPEYVFSMPALLKNALEWCVSETIFTDKRVAIISAAANGEKALEQVNMVLETIQAKLSSETNLVISGIKGTFDEEGGITSEALKVELTKVINSLLLRIK